MQFKKILLNLAVALSALLFGLAWVGVYQFFVEKTVEPKQETILFQDIGEVTFDINNPESVLPIDFEEDKLSDPKEDEDNPKYFDPEGRYYFYGEPKGFENVFLISINNKNFEVESDDLKFGDLIPPAGFILLEDTDKGAKDSCEMHDYIDLSKVNIEDGKMSFISKKKNGISYEFNGEFLVKGNFYTLDVGAKVLNGKLVKKKNGKIIAENDLTFGWTSAEKCLH